MKLEHAGVALALALAAAGCGATSGARQRGFLAHANRICSHFSALQNEVQFPSVDPLVHSTTHAARAEWAVSLKRVAYLGKQEVKTLRQLRAPTELQRGFTILIDTKDAAFDDLLTGADAARRNDVAHIAQPVAAGRSKLARSAVLAKRLGAQRCS
jgi:hypothetical protein